MITEKAKRSRMSANAFSGCIRYDQIEEMISLCFDVHFAFARFDRYPTSTSSGRCSWIERRKLLLPNWDQVKVVLQSKQRQDYEILPNDVDLTLNFDTVSDNQILDVLLKPDNPRLLAA